MRQYWLAFIATIGLVGLANMIGSFVFLHDSGTFGMTGQPTTLHANGFTVQSVTPHSPASAAGIHAGDQLTYAPRFSDRVVMLAPVPGDTVTLVDGRRTLTLTAVTDTAPTPWVLFIVVAAAKFAFIAIAIVIAWRRPDDAAARALALFLACFGAGLGFDHALLSNVVARFIAFLFVQTVFLVGALAAFTFACRFPSIATNGIRLALTRSIVPLALAGALITIASFMATMTAPNSIISTVLTRTYVALYVTVILATLAALMDSYRKAEREQRARMRWVIGTLAFGFSGIIVLFTGMLFAPQMLWLQYAALTVVAIPFGLGYVILRHRVIDIGFVVNRAVVYTVVSLVVVGGFIIFEWLLSHIVETNSRASAVIELAAALALGLSVRFIHQRVDRYVDDLFFRDRHIAEANIRRFAHETGLITDADILVRRSVEVAERNARLMGAAFFSRAGAQFVPLHSSFAMALPTIDENDQAVLEMRAWHTPVDVRGETLVPGQAAFPMIVRGQLAGFLACGEKATHEALAPDEYDALRVLARDAGIALDSLRIAQIEQELAYLAADGELPPTLRMRLAALLKSEGFVQPAGAAARSSQ